jgi:outer membrane protein insertion porin family
MSYRRIAGNEAKYTVRKHIFFISFFLLSAVCFLLHAGTDVSASVVGKVEIKGLYSIGRDELLYLFNISPGARIDADLVRQGIKRAFLKGMFEDIDVTTTDGEKVNVIIQVKERNLIKKIKVEGEYSLSQKTIKKLFPLKEGQELACDTLEKAVRNLRPEIVVRGFPHVEIKARVEQLKEPYRINVHLRVDAGKPERIKKISIIGAPPDDVESAMNLSEGDVFNRLLVETDIERIKAYYKKKEYFKPVVGPYAFADGDLSIPVNPGKRLEIFIKGNDHVSTKALLKEMPFFEVEEFSDDIVAEAVQKMISLYHAKGYPFAKISSATTRKDDLLFVRFAVSEGVRVEVGEINLTGNTLPDKRLKDLLSLKKGKLYNPDLLDSDRETLGHFYNSLGYLAASVDGFRTEYEEVSRRMDIFIKIHEGLKTVIDRITFSGAKHIPEEELKKTVKIKTGDPFNDVDISDARYRIIELYGNRGFTDATVSVSRELEDQKAHIIFHINEDGLVHFGKVIVTGNLMTKYVVIKRELEQEEYEPFDLNILSKERQKLYKLGLFSEINTEVLDKYDDRKDVLIKLKEANPGSVEVGVGYGQYERYRGTIDLSYRNLMGMNRQVSLRLEYSSLEKRYILQYFEPWFLRINLPFRAYILGEDKKEVDADTRETRYRLIRHTATAGFEKKLSESVKSQLFYEFSLVNTFDVKPDVILSREDTGTLVISGLRLGLIYDTRDSPFNPQRGIISGIAVKFTSPAFFSETDFIEASFYGNTFFKLSEGLVLAASLRGGVAQGYQKTRELPIVERFFLGGSTTVRGYSQDTLGPKGADGNPTGGNAFLMENLETRLSLGKGLGLVAFVDGGNVWQKANEIDLGSLKFTTGLGLRYITPVGPLRVDYGIKLRRERGESFGELHFSIGQAF